MRRSTFVLACAALLTACTQEKGPAPTQDAAPLAKPSTMRVGILHSMTGTMAISETPVVLATRMAIDEVNDAGGILGRKLEAVVADGKSDWPTFAAEAERLITQEKVEVVFGCWTSASRKTVKPVFEKHDHLLFYPVQYEGLEQSPNIIYTGAAPNQQIIPAVQWAFEKLGKKVFLVGSDYVFPRTANAIIQDQVKQLKGQVVGEEYALLGATDVAHIVKKIKDAKPNVILNTINGDTNVHFFKALRAAGITPAKIPTVSFSLAEAELQQMGVKELVGDYAAWNYFMSVDSIPNKNFIASFRARYGTERVTDDPMEAAYLGVHLWARAVGTAKSTQSAAVRKVLANESFDAPEGMVYVDGANNHTWKTARVGKIRPDGMFDVVWSSGKPVKPEPFPSTRTREEWERFLEGLYTGWNKSWANPGNGT
jgi:urea transport system substrate-binding protein